jgi:hypothetical protein
MSEKNLKKITDWADSGESVSIIANTGIQLLDFELKSELAKKHKSHFVEKKIDTETFDDEFRELEILSGDEITESNPLSEDYQFVSYEITVLKAIEPFLNNWIPIPFFRVSEAKQRTSCDIGPTSWSRMRISKVKNIDQSESSMPNFRIQLALDTTLGGSEGSHSYLQPNEKDTGDRSEFRFVCEMQILNQFLTEGADKSNLSTARPKDEPMWVTEWIRTVFDRYLQETNQMGRRNKKVDEDSKLEHWARYIALLKIVDETIFIPKVKLLPSPYLNQDTHAIDVDLILDIGNSRTCGLLIEQTVGVGEVDLSGAVPLELRDLSEPQYSYPDLFQSRVEFSDNNFGDERLARASGRNNAFIWPSFVRIGPEAIKLVQSEQGNETASGLSSPKRYLWDITPINHDWRFHQHKDPRRLPQSVAAALTKLTPEGDHQAQIEEDIRSKLRLRPKNKKISRANRPRFAKSSLYGFMVAEIITQAFVQINDASYRIGKPQTDVPRRLKRVILTLPTATPSQEQAIVKSKVSGALKMVWDRMMHWGTGANINKPDLLVDWDEASCTQVMFLYSEIVSKFKGRTTDFLRILGKKRIGVDNKEKLSIKIACIDIGGGTTDLMVTTYAQEGDVTLIPCQEFREGFRVAGDDLLAEVISSIILPKLKETVTGVSKSEIDAKFKDLFGLNVANIPEQTKQIRRQFGLRVLNPLAVALLEKSLQCSPKMKISPLEVLISKTNENPPKSLIDYLQQSIRSLGCSDWSLMDQEIMFTHEEVEQVFERLLGSIISNISEVVNELNVDLVLLTGRPSIHPVVRKMLVNSCVAPPNRIIAMHAYHAGSWYPFRNNENKVGDPKGTVAVGAMLITMSDRNIPNFYIPKDEFKMKSTAKYIGRMEIGGQIMKPNIYFKPDDGTDGAEYIETMATPIFIGSRQLDVERWQTSPLYLLDFIGVPGQRPYKVTIKRREFEDYSDEEYSLAFEAIKETIEIIEVEDKEGKTIPPDKLKLSFQTLGYKGDYWLDTGCFIP